MKKRYLRLFFIIYLLFLFFWTGNLYLNIKSAEFSKIIKIKVDCDADSFKLINAFRISPSDYTSELAKDDNLKKFLSKNNEYLKKIKIEIPKDIFDNVEKITIDFNIKSYSYSKNDLTRDWKNEIKGNVITLYSPDNIFYKRSNISFLKNIINWEGDFEAFFLNFINANIIFFLISIIIIILYKQIKKQIPVEIDKNNFNHILSDLDEHSKNKIIKNYSILNNKYILNDDIKFWDDFETSIIFDKLKGNYYNLFYFIFLIFIISFALLQRLTIDKMPYSGNDTWGYIGSAVNWLEKGIFNRILSRSFPYPLFVLINLRIFKDFSYITIVQHLSGVFSGILLLILWEKIFKDIQNNKFKLFIKFSGLLLSALFLFSESPITIEHDMRPEAIYPFFLMLQVIFLYYFICNFNGKSKYIYISGILFFINNYFLFVFQPRWGLTLFLNLIIYLIFINLFKDKIIKKILLFIAAPIIFSFLLIYVPENILFKNNPDKKIFQYGSLFWVHAKIINIEIKKDIDNDDYDKFDKTILSEIDVHMNKVFNESPRYHKYLGFHFNSFLYGEANNYLLSVLTDENYIKLCRYYIIKSIIKHPLLYSKKVLLELSQFYNFNGSMYTKRTYKRDYEEYKISFDVISERTFNNDIYNNYLNELRFFENSTYDFPKIKFPYMNFFIFLLSRTYIICLLLFIVFFTYNIKKKSINKKMFNLGLLILSIYLYDLFISLSVSMTFFFDINRYIDDQFILLLFSQFLTIIYFILNKEIFIKMARSFKKK